MHPRKPTLRPAGIAATMLFSLCALSPAATVITAGSVQGQNNWYTSGYGDVGYVFFGNSNSTPVRGGALTASTGTISLTKIGASTGGIVSGSQAIENPLGGTFTAGALFTTNITANDNPVNVASLTFQVGSPSSVRIGVLVGASVIAAGSPADFPQSIGLNNVTQTVTQPSTDTTSADWYFFDVTNITAGDTITIQSSRIADATNHRFNPINGVVISSISVPEPSVALLGGLGTLALLRRRRA